jgi:hypothetical protein
MNHLTEFVNSLTAKDIVLTVGVLMIQPILIKIRDLFAKTIYRSPHYVFKFLLWQRIRHKKNIKKMRWDGEEITFQSIRTHTYFCLFIGSIFFYLYLIILGPLKGIGLLPYSVQLLIYSPNLVLEAIWILQHAFTRELIDSRAKIRIKSKRNLRRTTCS